jgi:hypothetical protein
MNIDTSITAWKVVLQYAITTPCPRQRGKALTILSSLIIILFHFIIHPEQMSHFVPHSTQRLIGFGSTRRDTPEPNPLFPRIGTGASSPA